MMKSWRMRHFVCKHFVLVHGLLLLLLLFLQLHVAECAPEVPVPGSSTDTTGDHFIPGKDLEPLSVPLVEYNGSSLRLRGKSRELGSPAKVPIRLGRRSLLVSTHRSQHSVPCSHLSLSLSLSLFLLKVIAFFLMNLGLGLGFKGFVHGGHGGPVS
jgi:hypothetical protein